MQSILLSHSGHHFNYTIPFPSEWNELTPHEMELLAQAQMEDSEIQSRAKAMLLFQLIESRASMQKIKLPIGWRAILDIDDAATAGLDAIAFLFSENTRTINPYPVLRFGEKKLRGPADDFNSILCGEMEDCEMFFHMIKEKFDIDHCARIAAILWRPRNKPYDSKASEQRLAKFQSLGANKLISIFMWYAGCRNQLPLYFPHVYGGDDTGGQPDAAAFTKCIHAGAGPKNGTRKDIRIMPAKEFLFDMEQEAEKAEKIKEEYAK